MDDYTSVRRSVIALIIGYVIGMTVTEAITVLQAFIPLTSGATSPNPSFSLVVEVLIASVVEFGLLSVVMLLLIFVTAVILRKHIHYRWVFAGLVVGTLIHIVTVVGWIGGGRSMTQIEQLSAILGTGLYPPLFIGIATELVARKMGTE